ncbi:MAG: ABC transporter permease [Alicyclobacillus sp.]|nr:ABC transporter permease [Alicyclobacillus sp.]
MRSFILGSAISSRMSPIRNSVVSRRRRFHRSVGLYLGAAMVLTFVLAGLVGPWFVLGPDTTTAYFLSPPGHGFLLGTDQFGRSELSRILSGIRTSLLVIVLSMSASAISGTLVGLLSAWFRWFDAVSMRVMDILMAFPAILLAIGIMTMVGPGVAGVVEAVSIVYLPVFARVCRAPAMEQKSKEYVEAAIIAGVPTWRILVRHVLPNIWHVLVVQLSVAISDVILIEAALSYLGLGVIPPAPSLGSLLKDGQTMMFNAPWLAVFPGLAIAWAVLAFNLLGDGLRDLADVRNSALR